MVAEAASREEPQLGSQMNAVILSHDDLAGALSFQIARKLADGEMSAMSVREVCLSAFKADPSMVEAAEADLQAVLDRHSTSVRTRTTPWRRVSSEAAVGSSIGRKRVVRK